jgi:hypothetical protein
LRRKDVLLLAQLGLLAGPRVDPQVRSMFTMAVYSLELSNLLAFGKPGDYQVGLDARNARAALERHAWTPLGPVTDESGRARDARDWLRDQLLSRFRAAYL